MEQQEKKRYIVSCLSVSGAYKKIFKSGEIVTEDDFPAGVAEGYVRSKHLKRYDSTEFKEDVLKDANPETLNHVKLDDVVDPPGDDGTPTPPQTPDYESMTNKELKALLDEKQIEYGDKDNKAKLIELLTAAE